MIDTLQLDHKAFKSDEIKGRESFDRNDATTLFFIKKFDNIKNDPDLKIVTPVLI